MVMNNEYFNKLIEKRRNLANSFDDPAATGVWDSVVDKYSDQAHFVYELLQNADDTKATYARFKLYHDRLVFAHNGKRLFSVSDPDTEKEDGENGHLGDVNSILSIHHSSKIRSNTIGKFGVGFKAVFQYTATPYIYDPSIRFKIERFIVPCLIDKDHNERKSNETLFEFPFNHEKNTAEIAFKAISEKLSSLVNPILFLSNLQEIGFEFDDIKGDYRKEVIKKYTFDDTVCELTVLTKTLDEQTEEKKLWLFTRVDENNGKYAVGFYLDEDGNLVPANEYAYCFFPTKENTGLHFIIHAPFLLTDSREGIKSGDKHNQKMIGLLSNLAADCLVYLRDIGTKDNHKLITDNIVNIIPTNTLSRRAWGVMVPSDQSKFEPFYERILETFRTKEIIPSQDSYTISDNAYWAQNLTLISTFDNKALQTLTNNSAAQWVFTSIPREKYSSYTSSDSERSFIDNIISSWLDEDRILSDKYITPEFTQSRSIDWLAGFYNWISQTKNRMSKCKTLPIFLSADGKAVSAYNKDGNLILFLPTGEDEDYGYTTISEELLNNKDIAEFISSLKITKPSLKNEIYNKILPRIKKGSKYLFEFYFKKLFNYYMNECAEEDKEDYIAEVKKYEIIKYSTLENEGVFRGIPDTMYFPTEKLKDYFKVKPSTRFIDWGGYLELVGKGKEKEKFLHSFFVELGVSEDVKIITNELSKDEAYQIKPSWGWNIPSQAHWNSQTWEQSIVDGCKENIEYIIINRDFIQSKQLWEVMIKIAMQYNLSESLVGWHYYYNRRKLKERFLSTDISMLRNSKWLFTESGEMISPVESFATNLAKGYQTDFSIISSLINFLNMPYEDPKLVNLTSEQKKAVELFKRLKDHGINIDSLSDDKIESLRASLQDDTTTSDDYGSPNQTNRSSNIDSHHSNNRKNTDDRKPKSIQPQPFTSEIDDDADSDSDEYTPKIVNYQKKIDKAQAKCNAELDLIEQLEELQQKALISKRYSYGWFKALLELEAMESNENASSSREVSINFGKVEQEGTSLRTLVLKYPSRNIPSFMEELADIPLILEFENETKKLPIEVISIRSFTLRVKLKPNVDMSGIYFDKVKEARITAENPAFLLEELKKQLAKLGLEDNYDMQANLCENIDFIFGPPGTGKTTYLAKDIIIPKMKQDKNCKILVLAPTNKAADVIARKITEVMGADTSYNYWLVRFGSTDDEAIERSGIFKDKTFDLRSLERIATITTIDRFPYDFFMPNGERHYLRNQQYNYVIFDEASMIPLVKIIYPLFHNKPKEFIIAGDPFQIEPVVHHDMWKGENIYTMVNLKSFAEHETIHDYKVKPLTTQYRSIPIIGELFSQMTYDGILAHHRKDSDQVNIDFGDDIDVKPLNIIKFPVSKYESIYRPKRLNKTTPYHIYSALFAYEFTLWLANSINQNNPQKNIRIGVIAAYKAQADMIERLILSEKIPEHISVQTGTIHGFQGDECEIIISVYNPPPSISTKPDMFLNKKNIINVSISRARDYLFIVMPDDETENVDNLILIKKMEQLVKGSGQYTEYDSHSIEKIMLGSGEYLEENAFSTSHQSVNVYGLPEQKYEIRSEDSAIDIQIHKK